MTSLRSRLDGAVVNIDFSQIPVAIGVIAMMTGKLPFNKKTVGLLLIGTMCEFKMTWEL